MSKLISMLLMSTLIGCSSEEPIPPPEALPAREYMKLEMKDLRQVNENNWVGEYKGTVYRVEINKEDSKITIYTK